MNLAATQFDLGNARACAQASADAYRQDTLCDTTTDTHCLVVEEDDHILIAFRGTASIRNWITDAEFKRTLFDRTFPGPAEIHRGFDIAFKAIFDPLLKALGGIIGVPNVNSKPLVITGHSLGGALAIPSAFALHQNGFPIAQVYTFGQPRVGNGAFKAEYNKVLGDRTYRLVYQEDIVPRVPNLPAWNDFYRHVGSEVFLPSLVSSSIDPWVNPPLWRLLISDAWGLYRAFIVSKFAGALDPINDHFMKNYIAALQIPMP